MPTYTPEQKREYAKTKRQEAREALDSAVRNLRSSKGWHDALAAMGKFRNYSFANRLLIAWQNPDATKVASYKKWQDEFERKVSKGTKALKIYAPIFIKKRDEQGNEIKGEDGKPLTYTAFKLVPVFDISQTEGKDVPSIPKLPLKGSSHSEYVPLLQTYCNILAVDANPTETEPNAQVRELAHRAARAHETLSELPSATADVLAEAAAYVACRGFGFDIDGESIPYIASWATAELDELQSYAKTVDIISESIEVAVGARQER